MGLGQWGVPMPLESVFLRHRPWLLSSLKTLDPQKTSARGAAGGRCRFRGRDEGFAELSVLVSCNTSAGLVMFAMQQNLEASMLRCLLPLSLSAGRHCMHVPDTRPIELFFLEQGSCRKGAEN